MMTTKPSPTVRRRRLGLELRRLREQAGMTCEEVGRHQDCSGPRISRIETGHIGIRPGEVRELLDLYGVTDEAARDALVSIARDARKRGWWRDYSDVLPAWFEARVGLEAEATTLKVYETHLVPGLLQTHDYARAVLKAGQPLARPEEIERQVELRLDRQRLLGRDDPPHLWIVLSEAVLRIRVGGVQVLHAQLKHLEDVSELPHVTIQILPFGSDAHGTTQGPCSILVFPEPADPDVVYLEYLTGCLFLEREEEVASYALAFEHLQVEALGAARSLELIRQAASGL
jgi:transcriptional regulator with XRE-family HTH domain